MKAMILAAGVGNRLDPLTRAIPKPMVPVANRPVIEHIVRKLRKHGFDQIFVNLYYLGERIERHLGSGDAYGVNLTFVHEDRLWGDAGSVKRAADFLGNDTFLVVGGDDISDIDLTGLIAFHKENKAVATIALSEVDDPSQYGIVMTDADGRVNRFLEKPISTAFSNTANTGLYVFEPDVFDIIPDSMPFGFGHDVLPTLLEQDRPLYGFASAAYWKDVGSLRAYRQANFDALTGKVKLDLHAEARADAIWVAPDAEIHPSAQIHGPALIGAGSIVEADAVVYANTVVGEGCRVGRGAVLRDTITWSNVDLAPGTQLEHCIVGHDVTVGSNFAIFEGLIMDPRRHHAPS